MKTAKTLFLAVLFVTSVGRAVPSSLLYSENFSDATAYPDSYTVSDGTSWVTNDANEQNVVSENGVAYGFGDGSRVGILGYRGPISSGTGGVSLLGHSVDRLGNSLLRLQVDQIITNSSSTRPNDDSFGWTITSGGQNLVRAIFAPKTSNLAAGESADNTLLIGSYSFNRNQVYRLQIWMDLADGVYGVDAAPAAATGSPSVLNASPTYTRVLSGSLLNLAYGSDLTFNATWDLQNKTANGTGAYDQNGNNYMAFTNIKVENVPEPTSASMLLTGLAAWALSRRRRS